MIRTIDTDDDAVSIASSSTETENKNEIDDQFTFTMNDADLKGKLHSVLFQKGTAASWDFDAVRNQMGNKNLNSVDLDVTIARRKAMDLANVNQDQQEAQSEQDENASEIEDHNDLNQLNAQLEVDDETTENVDLTGVKFEDALKDRVVDKKVADFFADDGIIEQDDETMQTQTFTEMNLSRPLLKALSDVGFVTPTKIQTMAIPLALQGRDICGAASTGSGKSAAFLLPILQRLLFKPKNVASIRVLILTPTRELAAQCYSVAIKLAKYTSITMCLCTGGLSNQQQEHELKKRPDIVIATPGRLIDHLHNSASFGLDDVEIVVMDEADRMLEDGFQAELTEIVKNCPHGSQRLLFSATMTDNVDKLIAMSLHRPVRLFIDSVNSVATKLVQEFIRVRVNESLSDEQQLEQALLLQREAILLSLCVRTYKTRVIIFFPSKIQCHRFRVIFGLIGLSAAELHGNLTQLQRIESLERFRDGQVDFLLATDLASRGLDIAGIETVINFQMPPSYERYVHRVGRTARNNKGGMAVTLVGEKERKMVKQALKNLQNGQVAKQRVVPTSVIANYREKIASMQKQVDLVLEDEREEKTLRSAEMQLKKAENMNNHADEIAARPARTWFQTGKEKMENKQRNRESHADSVENEEMRSFAEQEVQKIIAKIDPKRTKFSGLSRKQKRRKMLDGEEGGVSEVQQKVVAKAAKKSARQNGGKIQKNLSTNKSGSKSRKSKKFTAGFSKEI